MKKQIKLFVAAVVALTLSLATVSAQSTFKKSDKFVEGSVSYSKSNGSDATYNVQPTVGYFVTDRVAVGVFAQIGKDQTNKTTGVGAFGRCYILDIGKNLKTYSQLNIGNSTVDVAGVKASTFGTDLAIGANYFISSKLALSVDVASLMSYASQGSNNTFTIGWTGVTNPLSVTKFGVLYKF